MDKVCVSVQHYIRGERPEFYDVFNYGKGIGKCVRYRNTLELR
jgi:hypothetical protein